jgi:hypothetical protein
LIIHEQFFSLPRPFFPLCPTPLVIFGIGKSGKLVGSPDVCRTHTTEAVIYDRLGIVYAMFGKKLLYICSGKRVAVLAGKKNRPRGYGPHREFYP